MYRIDDLKFSVRTTNALKRAGVFFVNDLCKLTAEDLYNIKNMGEKSVNEIMVFQENYSQLGNDYLEDIISGMQNNTDMLIDENTTVIEFVLKEKITDSDKVCYRDRNGIFVDDLSVNDTGISTRTTNHLLRAKYFTVSKVATEKYGILVRVKGLGAKGESEIIEYLSNNVEVRHNYFDDIKKIDGIYNAFINVIKTQAELFDESCISNVIHTLLLDNYETIISISKETDLHSVVMSQYSIDNIWGNEALRDRYKQYILKLISDCSSVMKISLSSGYFPLIFTKLGITSNVVNELCSEGRIEFFAGGYRLRLPTIDDWVLSLEGKQKLAVEMRLDDKTLEECGNIIGVTRERVRQIVGKAKEKKPLLREDDYRYWFEKYNFNQESFCMIFNASKRVYLYLNELYKPGRMLVDEMINDDSLSLELYEALTKFINRNSIYIEDEYVPCKRDLLCRKLVQVWYSNSDATYEEFYARYIDFLKENNLDDDEKLVFPSVRAFEARVADSDVVLCTYGRKIRYYPIVSCDIESLVGALHFEQFVNIEISAQKLFIDNNELMEDYDIHDEYELHNLLNKTQNVWNSNANNIKLTRMPFIGFGDVNRERQTRDLLYRLAPIELNKFCECYEIEYGVKANTVLANFFKYVSEFYHNGLLTIDQPLFSEEENEYMVQVISEDFYFIEDVKKLYISRFGEANISVINPRTLKNLGYRVYTNYIIKNNFSSADEYFRSLYLRNDRFYLGDFDTRLSYVQASSIAIDDLRNEYKIIEYEDMRYLKFEKLVNVYPTISKDMFSDYVDKAIAYSGTEDYFTIHSLISAGFDDFLHGIGLGEWFLSGLIRSSKKLKYIKTAGTIVFFKGNYQIFTVDFIKYVLQTIKSMNIYDFCDYLKNEYGVFITKEKINQAIKNSDIYYDAVMEKIYLTKKYYYEEL